ncbi:MAG: SRPBCC domain-containing protein [Treponema sp.]|nr:SRPBCC domain-containing protein [Treponema sp.]
MKKNEFSIKVQLLVWKPVNEVFRAFIDPDITGNFWFSKSTGMLEEGKTVTWEWKANNASALIKVEEIIENKLIKFDWGDPIPKVEITFATYGDNATLVVMENFNETHTVGEIIDEIIESTANLTSVLDGLKAYLEHNIKLNLIEDKFPG